MSERLDYALSSLGVRDHFHKELVCALSVLRRPVPLLGILARQQGIDREGAEGLAAQGIIDLKPETESVSLVRQKDAFTIRDSMSSPERRSAHDHAGRFWQASADGQSIPGAGQFQMLIEFRFHLSEAALLDEAERLSRRMYYEFEYLMAPDEEVGFISETLDWVTDEPRARGMWLGTLATFHQRRGDWEKARQIYEESLALSEAAGDRRSEAVTCHELGILFEVQGEFERAEYWFSRAMGVAKALNDRPLLAKIHYQLGMLKRKQGDPPSAESGYMHALALEIELEDHAGALATLRQLAELAREQSDIRSAEEFERRMRQIRSLLYD